MRSTRAAPKEQPCSDLRCSWMTARSMVPYRLTGRSWPHTCTASSRRRPPAPRCCAGPASPGRSQSITARAASRCSTGWPIRSSASAISRACWPSSEAHRMCGGAPFAPASLPYTGTERKAVRRMSQNDVASTHSDSPVPNEWATDRHRPLTQPGLPAPAPGQSQSESERHHRAIFENPFDVIAVLDAVRGASGAIIDWRYCNANTNWLRAAGRPREQLLGKTVSEVLPERAADLIPLYTRVLTQSRPYQCEDQWGGTDVLVSVFPIGRDSIVTSGVDISARTRIEAEVKRLLEVNRAE